MDDIEITPEMQARYDAYLAWIERKRDLTSPLRDDEWARLRVELRVECAPHPKRDPLYRWATDCEHDVPTYSYRDDLHVPDEDGDVICRSAITGYACFCGDGYCDQLATAEAAREELWYQAGRTAAERRAW